MSQPNWEVLANLGDSSFAEYGGMVLYRDTTGVYDPEVEVWLTPDDCGERKGYVYRFAVEQLKEVGCSCGCNQIRHVTYGLGNKSSTNSWGLQYDLGLPYPIHTYGEWFWKDLDSVASFIGSTVEQLREDLHSEDPRVRAWAYKAIGDYHGMENLDSYPLRVSRKEAIKRYADVPTHYQRAEVKS